MAEASSTIDLACRYFRQTSELYGDRVYTDQDFSVDLPRDCESLVGFERTINQCQQCALGETRTKFVFGVGNPHADLVFVGEAPGREEDLKGNRLSAGRVNCWIRFWRPSI